MRFYEHLIGDQRIKNRFLLFPKTIGKETRWLEYTRWIEIYCGGQIWRIKMWANE